MFHCSKTQDDNQWRQLLTISSHHYSLLLVIYYQFMKNNFKSLFYKKLSYCWETVRRESMPRIAEMDVEMTT